jgi:hypothetical protein
VSSLEDLYADLTRAASSGAELSRAAKQAAPGPGLMSVLARFGGSVPEGHIDLSALADRAARMVAP